MELLKNCQVKARKPHKCNWCNLEIQVKEIYENSVIKNEGCIYTWKNHIRCRKIASKLDMFSDCEDGVTSSDFHEYIRSEYSDNIDEYYEPINNLTFEEILNYVCELRLKPLKT
jgi:hypothetical protein